MGVRISGKNLLPLVLLLGAIFLSDRIATSFAAEVTGSVADENQLTVLVMDPLALPLSCPCVRGYAQRDYEKLGVALSAELHRDVKVVFNESIVAAVAKDPKLTPQIVIGKHSVVLADAAATKLSLSPFASLTGKDGETTQYGMVVVAKDDPAQDITDLTGYRIFFGPKECDEKHAAAQELLQRNHIPLPDKIEIAAACDEGARMMLELGSNVRSCAVISSYAQPLLEGCGKIEKGALRVVGKTERVPFVEAFVNNSLPEAEQRALKSAILKSTTDPGLVLALETKQGFVTLKDATKKK